MVYDIVERILNPMAKGRKARRAKTIVPNPRIKMLIRKRVNA